MSSLKRQYLSLTSKSFELMARNESFVRPLSLNLEADGRTVCPLGGARFTKRSFPLLGGKSNDRPGHGVHRRRWILTFHRHLERKLFRTPTRKFKTNMFFGKHVSGVMARNPLSHFSQYFHRKERKDIHSVGPFVRRSVISVCNSFASARETMTSHQDLLIFSFFARTRFGKNNCSVIPCTLKALMHWRGLCEVLHSRVCKFASKCQGSRSAWFLFQG